MKVLREVVSGLQVDADIEEINSGQVRRSENQFTTRSGRVYSFHDDMNSHTMQLYINRQVEVSELIKTLSSLLGIRLEALDYPDDQATGFVMLVEYDEGFPIGINISWSQDVAPQRDAWEVAKQLAGHYNTLVATDFLEGDVLQLVPFCWCVAEPDGTLFKVSEKILQADEVEGLLLDLDSKEPLQEKQKV